LSLVSVNDGRHGGTEFIKFVDCKFVRWWVCTTIKHDSHWTSDKSNVGFGFLQEKNEHAGDDDGSVGLYGNQQWDIGCACSLQLTPYNIWLFDSDDDEVDDDDDGDIDCRVLKYWIF